jgi:hypothetical protein
VYPTEYGGRVETTTAVEVVTSSSSKLTRHVACGAAVPDPQNGHVAMGFGLTHENTTSVAANAGADKATSAAKMSIFFIELPPLLESWLALESQLGEQNCILASLSR